MNNESAFETIFGTMKKIEYFYIIPNYGGSIDKQWIVYKKDILSMASEDKDHKLILEKYFANKNDAVMYASLLSKKNNTKLFVFDNPDML